MSALRLDDRHDRPLELAAVAVDFDLTAVERGELEAHVAGCPSCARRVAALRADARALSRPLTLLPSARVDDAVYAAIAGRQPRPQRFLILAATALLLLALLGAVAVGAYLLQRFEALPTTVTPTQPVAEVSPAPDASPAVIGETWETIPFDDSGGSIEAVTFMGTDLVGVGRGGCVVDSGGSGECTAAAWRAGPGEGWVRAPDQPGLVLGPAVGTSSPQAGIFRVADGPAGAVAIGYADEGRPRVWRSSDGLTWQRIEIDDRSPAVVARLSAVTASQDGYLVVGWIIDPANMQARAAAWASPDGLAWTRAGDNADMDVGPCFQPGDDYICGGMLGVVATTSGYVAVGHDRGGATGTGPGQTAAWTSPDGLTWTRTETGFDGGSLSGVTVGGPGLVAVGTICSPDCADPIGDVGLAATSVDGSTWSVEYVAGSAPFDDVVAAGGRLFAIGIRRQDTDPAAALELWRSDDGVAWQRVTSLPSIAGADGGADIAAAADRVIIVGWESVTGVDGVRNFAYLSPPMARQTSGEATPQPSASPVAASPIPGSLPIAAGNVNSVPGPSGGLYVVASAPQQGQSGPAGRTVMVLLDSSGAPRAGWPIELVGWTCLRPGDDDASWTPSTDADGSLQVVCFSDDGVDGTWRTTAFAFDPGARLIGSWPLAEGAFDPQPRIIDSRLHAISRDENAPDTIWMTMVEADGTVRRGQPITIAGLGQLQLGPDGTGYGISYSGDDGAGPVQSEVQAFDMAGPRAGWPVRIDGFVPSVALGSDGRLYATSELDGVSSRTYGFDSSGRSLASESRVLPITAANEWSGAGPGRTATMLVSDGTAYVRGESSGRMFVFGLDPSGTIMDGWPYVSTVEPQWKGACSGQDTGCGVWQATNAVGSDGTFFLIQAAPHDKTGGSLVAIAPDGTVRPGWPVYLTKAGASFWSVDVGADGTAYALAVEPEAGRATSATILAIAPDSTIRWRATVVEP